MGSKEAVRQMPPMQMVGIRQIIAGLAYVLFFVFKGDPLPRKKDWWPIVLLSFLNFLLSNGLATWGVKYTSAGLSAIIAAIFPLWLVIVLTFQDKQKLPSRAWFGMLLGFAGILIVFYDHLQDLFNPEFILGIVMALTASLTWAYGTIFIKKFASDFNPYHSIGWQMLLSGVTVSLIAIPTGQTIPWSEVSLYTWSAIMFLVIVSSIIAFLAYIYVLQKLPTGIVALYAYINPIVAVIVGSLFFDEVLTVWMMTGALVTLAGVYIVNHSLNRNTKKKDAGQELPRRP